MVPDELRAHAMCGPSTRRPRWRGDGNPAETIVRLAREYAGLFGQGPKPAAIRVKLRHSARGKRRHGGARGVHVAAGYRILEATGAVACCLSTSGSFPVQLRDKLQMPELMLREPAGTGRRGRST